MKQRPIIFSTPMVKAILNGTKTQTRRIVKGIPEKFSIEDLYEYSPKYFHEICPYGKPGDVLWVRETFDPTGCMGSILYKANYSEEDLKKAAKGVFKWKPSIYMPKKLARIFLEITDVTIEKLQDISRDDSKAEGIGSIGPWHFRNYLENNFAMTNPKNSFETLWKSINGKDSWVDNPYVWVVKFKQMPNFQIN